MNLKNVSDENGGPLSVNSHLGGQYCEMCHLNLSCIDPEVLEEGLHMKRGFC